MKYGKALLIVGAALLLSKIAAAKKFLKDFKVEFLSGKFDYNRSEKAGFKQIYFLIRAKVGNKTDLAGTLQSAKVEVYWDKKKLGWVDLKNSITIKAGTDTYVEIPVRVETFNVIRSIPQLLQIISNNQALVFHIKGPLNFNVGTYTVDQDIKVPLLTQ